MKWVWFVYPVGVVYYKVEVLCILGGRGLYIKRCVLPHVGAGTMRSPMTASLSRD